MMLNSARLVVASSRSPRYVQSRHASGLAARLLARVLRLRYLLVGAGVGGAYTLNQKYDEFTSSLPHFGYIKNYLPDPSNVRSLFLSIRDAISTTQIDSTKVNAEQTVVVESREDSPIECRDPAPTAEELAKIKTESEKAIEGLRAQLLKTKLRYEKTVNDLQTEIKSLRTQLMLKYQKTAQPDRIKKTLIDMYSEVLDELASLDAAYNPQDHLPRVVVIGDQSSGKTSVLEMIAQARIFPRGSGEMMTRSPVKVTLSEGPYHVASFRDSNKEYDLTNETELATLRNEIETRMQALVGNGKTISTEVISLSVKGPGLQRMVLVDLPGIISTQTSGMESGTREIIRNLAKQYMENPNSIILCIQDGSIDAERSNVTDLVTSVDPHGKRTIFVLTKVDLAEANLYNPNRIREILEGRLFPMKALGYFAVVTGKGAKNESIESIKEYEASFFKKSRLFREGALQLGQMTTENMSKAVSERFWKMVKDSVVQEADTYRAIRYNLETEWKNTFPHLREMDRDELFDKARNEILDNLVSLSTISSVAWERNIQDLLWKTLQPFVFEKIFEPAQLQSNLGAYQTMVDVLLRDWSQQELPNTCVQTGWQVLYGELERAAKLAEQRPGYDHIFDRLKEEVIKQTRERHQWDSKALNRLRVIQNTTLEDHNVHTKSQWDAAVTFLENSLHERIKEVNRTISELRGPGFISRWLYWKSPTTEQKKRVATIDEILQLLASQMRPETEMAADDVTTVRRNLAGRKITVSNKFIRKTYAPLVQQVNLVRALSACQFCRRGFYYYQQGFIEAMNDDPDTYFNSNEELPEVVDSRTLHDRSMDSSESYSASSKSETKARNDPNLASTVAAATDFTDCREVVLFSRLLRMIDATSNSLRQQIVNDEIRRMEQLVKTVLNEISEDPLKLNVLITGKRVQLAEDLKRTRHIQGKLEDFIAALNSSD